MLAKTICSVSCQYRRDVCMCVCMYANKKPPPSVIHEPGFHIIVINLLISQTLHFTKIIYKNKNTTSEDLRKK